MKILLIGTGYVGKAILASWENEKDSFTATTTTESKIDAIQSEKCVEKALLLNVNKNTNLSPILETCDVLIVTVAPAKNANYKETYLETALAIKRGLAGRKKAIYIVYTSSTSVYGNHQGALVDEESNRASTLENGKILSQTEDVYLSLSSPLVGVCILRLGGINGPMRTLESRTLKMSKKQLEGSGKEVTNHIHLEDIPRAIEFCVIKSLKGIYNLVNDDHPTREELYRKISSLLKVPPPIWKLNRCLTPKTNAKVSNLKIKGAGFTFIRPHLDL